MASRESQGLQVALILFVMITVALGVTTYIFYDKTVKMQADVDRAKEDSQIDATRYKGVDSYNKLLLWMIGETNPSTAEITEFKNDLAVNGASEDLKSKFDAIESKFKAQMKLFEDSGQVLGGEAWDKGENWQTLPDYLVQIIQNRNLNRISAEDQRVRVEADATTKVAAAENRVTAAETSSKASSDQVVAVTGQFTTEVTKLKGTTGVLQGQITAGQEQYKTLEDRYSRDIKAAQGLAKKQDLLVSSLKVQKQELERKDYDVPDGQISWVDQKSRIVYINLGMSDGLRRQQTFSVYNRDESNTHEAKSKAAIEVTRIIERHLSEARIIDDEVKNPILPGDYIFTPTWVPGRKVHFGLAGFMDFNGDKKSDRHLLKSQILANNGVIDAEVDDDGNRTGKMSVHTRYLVLGDRPTDKSAEKGRREYGKMVDEAQQLGVETISVEKLLGYMGYKGEAKTTQLGRRGAAEAAGGGGDFKPRTPERGGKGAY